MACISKEAQDKQERLDAIDSTLRKGINESTRAALIAYRSHLLKEVQMTPSTNGDSQVHKQIVDQPYASSSSCDQQSPNLNNVNWPMSNGGSTSHGDISNNNAVGQHNHTANHSPNVVQPKRQQTYKYDTDCMLWIKEYRAASNVAPPSLDRQFFNKETNKWQPHLAYPRQSQSSPRSV